MRSAKRARPLAIGTFLLAALACDEPPPPRSPSPKERDAALEQRALITGTVVVEAVRQYRAGGTREELARALSGVAEKTTPGGVAATYMLEGLRAKPAYDVPPSNEIDVLVKARIDALVEEKCEPSEHSNAASPRIEALIGLGFTALDALEGSKKDRRLTRCVGWIQGDPGLTPICAIDPSACPGGPGPAIPRVSMVGDLVRSALYQLEHGRRTIDRSDVECDHRGGADRAPDDLLAAAIANHDWPHSIALVRHSAGYVRVRMIDLIAKALPAQDARAFLLEEAMAGRVLGARMRAIEVLRDAGDRQWPVLAAATIDVALSNEDDEHPRCDGHLVASRFPSVLDKFPKEAAAGLAKGFASYSPRTKADVVRRILTTSSPLTAEGAALAAEALKDTRSTKSEYNTNRWHCPRSTPSDVVALHVGPRVGVSYDCSLSAEDKAHAVEAILAKRGKVPGW